MAGLRGLSSRRQATPAIRGSLGVAVGLAVLVPLAAPGSLASGQDGPDQAVTPPVGIRTPQLLSPPAMAGAGIDPEVELKVDIDETGAVRRVQVLAIEPSTRFDDLLRASVTESLKRWRYGPARDAGDNPVPSSMTWRMKFVGREGGASAGSHAPRGMPAADLRALAGSDALPMNR